MPALLNAPSNRPWVSTIDATAAAAAPASATFSSQTSALPPAVFTCATTSAARVTCTSATTTCTLACARRSTVARPIPLAPPVTRTTRLSTFIATHSYRFIVSFDTGSCQRLLKTHTFVIILRRFCEHPGVSRPTAVVDVVAHLAVFMTLNV